MDNDLKPGSYTKDWVLNMGDYLNSDYTITGSTFKCVLLKNGHILVNEYSEKRWNLVEVDPENGSFVTSIPVEAKGPRDLIKRKDGSVLVVGYSLSTDLHYFGIYNEASHQVDFFSNIKSSLVNYPPNVKTIVVGDNSFYTYNSIISPSTEDVYLARWDFDGSLLWRILVDPSGKEKTAWINFVHDDHLMLTTVADYDYRRGTGEWKVAKISSESEIHWIKKVNDFGRMNEVVENAAGEFFVLNSNAITKHDEDGDEIWSTQLTDLPKGQILSRALLTSDGGLLFEYDSEDILLVKINSNGKIVWKQTYWEKNEDTGGIGFYELPDGDLIVTSLSGFITNYKLNK